MVKTFAKASAHLLRTLGEAGEVPYLGEVNAALSLLSYIRTQA